jgi:hypothetical protein
MSKWFVGQRVKLARPIKPSWLGAEGHIYTLLDKEYPPGTAVAENGLSNTIPVNCIVVWDCDGETHMQHTDQLEPIVPEGMQPASWEDTVWDPSRLIEESKELVCT